MSRTGNVVPIFAFLLTLVIVAPLGAPGAGVARADDCKTCANEKEYRATLEELAYYFDNLYITTYRTIMFRQISEARNLDVNEVLQRLEIALAFAKEKGGDGIEPVILLYADALGQSKREWWMAEASKAVGAAEIKYRHPVPYEAMLQPFGRVHTRMILSVRPSISRAMLSALIKNPKALRIETLVGLQDLQDNVCAVKKIRGDTDLLKQLAGLDKAREADCSTGAIGGLGGASRMPQTLGDIGLNACVDVSLDRFKDDKDEYTTADQMADLKQCMQDMTDARHPAHTNPLAEGDFGLPDDELLKEVLKTIAEASLEEQKQSGETSRERWHDATLLIKAAMSKYVEELAKRAEEERQLNHELIEAKAQASGADAELTLANTDAATDEAAAEKAEAESAVADQLAKNAHDAANSCGGGCTPEDQADRDKAAAAADTDAATKREKAAKLREQATKSRGQRTAAAAKAAAANARVNAILDRLKQLHGGQDVPDENPFASAACSRLIANGTNFMDPVGMKKLPSDWTDLKSKLDRVSQPDPNAPVEGSDAFALPSCGKDLATTTGVSNCRSLTDCAPGDEQCACNLSAENKEAELQKFLAKAEVFACVDAQCPSGQTPVPHGQVCSCTGGDTQIGHRPPLPISQIFLDFDAMPAASVYATDGALSGAASEILRSKPAVVAP